MSERRTVMWSAYVVPPVRAVAAVGSRAARGLARRLDLMLTGQSRPLVWQDAHR